MSKKRNNPQKTESQRPPLAAMACDAKRFLGLRADIRELINVSNPPSRNKFIAKNLHHPVLGVLHKLLLSDLGRNKQ